MRLKKELINVVFYLQDCLNNKSSNKDSIKDEISETGEAHNESQLINIQSFTSQLNGDYQANKASVKNNDENSGKAKVINLGALGFDVDYLRLRKGATSDTKKELIDEGFLGALDTSGQDYELNKEDEMSGANDNVARRNKVLEYLTTVLHKNRAGNEDGQASKANRRLDIEDNGDDFADLVDIDDSRLNYYNQDAADDTEDIKATKRFMGYGARLDKKGRSGTFIGEGKMDKSPVGNFFIIFSFIFCFLRPLFSIFSLACVIYLQIGLTDCNANVLQSFFMTSRNFRERFSSLHLTK